MVTELDLPESFRLRILASGDRSERARWLRDLPDVVATLAERWELRVGERFPLSWSYVVAARRESGDECVLKIGPPVGDEDEGTVREGLALRLAGQSAVSVLEEDDDAGALLLQRATGGPLSAMCERDDGSATEILAHAMLGFWVAAGPESGLPPLSRLEDTFEEFDRGPHGASYRGRDLAATLGEIDSGVRELRAAAVTARRVLEELLADRAASVLVHGDLHHDNVLEDEAKGWLVIDPKGFFGDPGYDVAAMFYNPMPFPLGLGDMEALVRRRLDAMSDITRIDDDKLAAWGYVKAVLSLLWSLQVGEISRHDVRMYTMATLRNLI
ncbi:MAG: aminoglycoside phosphotransferase family protein [Acidimicrobiales bacterium]